MEAAVDPAAVRDQCTAEYPHLRADIELAFELELTRRRAAPPSPPKTLLVPGDRLGAFRVERFVAKGGMGEVYEAWQEEVERRVALKVSARPFANESTLAQFAREHQVPARLHQTHVVPIHYAGHAEVRGSRLWYYAMHFVDGAPLSALLTAVYQRETSRPAGRVTPPLTEVVGSLVLADSNSAVTLSLATGGPAAEAGRTSRVASGERFRLSAAYFVSVAETMREVGEAVGYLHAHGVRHRDIKPANVMMDRTGASYLIDFGLAIRKEDAALPAEQPAALWPVEPGTPEYMAPEQYAGPGRPPGPVDVRADVYALGVTLYELLTLRPAFRDADRGKLAARVIAGEPSSPRELVTNVPKDLAAVCRKAMSADPGARYVSAAGFADDLRCWAEWAPTAARPGWATLRPLRLWAWRNKARAAAVGAVALLLLGSTAWAVQRAEARKAELERVERDRRFEQEVLAAQELRLGPAYAGWSDDAVGRLKDARDIRPDANLRYPLAATFVGPDARLVRRYDLPRVPGTGVGLGDVVFSPDGRRILAGGSTESRAPAHRSPALLWDDVAARDPVLAAVAGAGPVVFPDPDTPLHLLLPTDDRRAFVLRNVTTGGAIAEIPAPDRAADDLAAAVSADARFAGVTFGDGSVPVGRLVGTTQLWALDPKRPGVPARKVGEWPQHATALAFAADGRYLAAGTGHGEVIVRVTADGREVLRIAEAGLPVTAVAFGRNSWRGDGERPDRGPGRLPLLAVATKGGGLGVWDLEARRRVNSFHGSYESAYAVAFSPDGATLASAGRSDPSLWDVASGRRLLRLSRNRLQPLRNWMTGLAFAPDGRRLAVAGRDAYGDPGGLDVFELEDGRGVRSLRGLSGQVESVCLSSNGKWVAALARNWQLAVWDRPTGGLRFVCDVPPGWFTDNAALAFDEGRGEVLVASGTRATRWDLATGDRTGTWELPLGLNDCLAVPPGRKPILIRRDPIVLPPALAAPAGEARPRPERVLRARELEEGGAWTDLYPIAELPPQIHNCHVTADGRFLLVNGRDADGNPHPYLYDGKSGRPIPVPAMHDPLSGGVLSPAGTFLAGRTYGDRNRASVLKLPDLTPHATDPGLGGPLLVTDDTGSLVAYPTYRTPETDINLARLGRPEPLLTFDAGRSASTGVNQLVLSDGRSLAWGRDDGAVCLADVTRCLEQLTAFAGR
jgi:serine/threonine protein kinase/WD40 repeat protein